MSDLALTFLRPLWGLAVIAVIVAGWWAVSRSAGFGNWERVTDPQLMKAMRAIGKIQERSTNLIPVALLLVAGLIGVALTGPAVERRDAQTYRNLDSVFFVIDASKSVTEDERWPQMLTMGQFGVSALGSRPGGIIVFAGDAYVAVDLTTDHLQLGQTLPLIDAGTVPDKGSRPERALELAAKRIDEAGILAGDIFVFTDGAGLGPQSLQQTALLESRGIRVNWVALHARSAQLQTLASVGGGAVFSLDQTDDLSRWVADDAATRLERADYPILLWHDLGRYLLVLALLPMLFLFRREQT